jgi:hypothetical protein
VISAFLSFHNFLAKINKAKEAVKNSAQAKPQKIFINALIWF